MGGNKNVTLRKENNDFGSGGIVAGGGRTMGVRFANNEGGNNGMVAGTLKNNEKGNGRNNKKVGF